MASKKPAGKAGQGPALQTAYLNTDSGPASGPAGTPRQPAARAPRLRWGGSRST